jgi:preprotein translocase subunit SecD
MHSGKPTPPAASPAAKVTTTITLGTNANVPLTPAQRLTAERVVAARAGGLGLTDVAVRAEGSSRLVVTTTGPRLTGSQTQALSQLGAAEVLQFRPLISEPVAGQPSASKSARAHTVDPWRSLGFAPPADAAALAALTPDQQQAVQAVQKNWDCANVSINKADSPIIACDSGGTSTYLLGPAIVDAGDVATGSALAPGSGPSQWTVNVDLTPAGQQRWTEYTGKHNESTQAGSVENVVADVLDGRVIVASTIQAEITGTTQIIGNFDQTSATSLATALGLGTLPVPFTVITVSPR